MTNRPTGAAKGRPRDAELSAAIEKAVLDALQADGYAKLSILSVAKACNTTSAAIYRRWPNKEALVVDVVRRVYEDFPFEETGDLRTDLLNFLRVMREAADDPVLRATIPALLGAVHKGSEHRSLLAEVIAPRREFAIAMIRTGIDAGDIAPGADPDLLVSALAGFVYYRGWIAGGSFSDDEAAGLVDLVLRSAPADRKRRSARRAAA